jgi:signal transduction histidine kinase
VPHSNEKLAMPKAIRHASGGAAHDFNNLLTVIIGNAEFLSDQLKAHPKLRRLAEDIAAAGERGIELAQRLMDTPAADAGARPERALSPETDLVERMRDAPPSKN